MTNKNEQEILLTENNGRPLNWFHLVECRGEGESCGYITIIPIPVFYNLFGKAEPHLSEMPHVFVGKKNTYIILYQGKRTKTHYNIKFIKLPRNWWHTGKLNQDSSEKEIMRAKDIIDARGKFKQFARIISKEEFEKQVKTSRKLTCPRCGNPLVMVVRPIQAA